RRRHTRSKRDWSSDVCSSDLGLQCHELWNAGISRIFLLGCVPCSHLSPLVLGHLKHFSLIFLLRLVRVIINGCFIRLLCLHCYRSEERRVGKECRFVCAGYFV